MPVAEEKRCARTHLMPLSCAGNLLSSRDRAVVRLPLEVKIINLHWVERVFKECHTSHWRDSRLEVQALSKSMIMQESEHAFNGLIHW